MVGLKYVQIKPTHIVNSFFLVVVNPVDHSGLGRGRLRYRTVSAGGSV